MLLAACSSPPPVNSGVRSTDDAQAPEAGGDAATLPAGADILAHVDAGQLLIDGDNLYFASGAKVMKLPLAGGAPAELAPSCCAYPALAQDAVNIYFAEWGAEDATGSHGFIRAVPKAGGAVTKLATEQSFAGPVAADADNVYWAVRDINGNGTIRAVSNSGGTARDLAPAATATSITAGGGYVYWGERTGYHASRVMRVAIGGGTPDILGSFQTDPADLALDAGALYVALASTLNVDVTFDDGQILRIPLDGGATQTLASGQRDPRALALDPTNVYWTNRGAVAPPGVGGLAREPLAGGAVETLATLDGATGLVVDATHAYWSQTCPDTDCRLIARMPK